MSSCGPIRERKSAVPARSSYVADAAQVTGSEGRGRNRRSLARETVVRARPNRAPLVYVCVYRQVLPNATRAWDVVNDAATRYPDLAELLKRYRSERSVYDWGDDPSFFSAEYHDGRPELAAWGVCRPNVREKLYPGDIVLYFCARRLICTGHTEYFYAGVGTVGVRIEDRRREVWSDSTSDELRRFRNHLNVLVTYDNRDQCVRHERFPPGHPVDWHERADSPYIVFDPARSKFNMKRPLRVAVAQHGAKNEIWISDGGARIMELRAAVFDDLGVTRGLRTSYRGTAHPHINLTRKLAEAGISADEFRSRVIALV